MGYRSEVFHCLGEPSSDGKVGACPALDVHIHLLCVSSAEASKKGFHLRSTFEPVRNSKDFWLPERKRLLEVTGLYY